MTVPSYKDELIRLVYSLSLHVLLSPKVNKLVLRFKSLTKNITEQ